VERKFRVSELILGLEGLALLRNVVDGDDDFINARIEEIRRFATQLDEPSLSGKGPDATELGVAAGYAAAASIYDSLPDFLIEAEEPVVHDLLGCRPIGDALDAACGTGRHTTALVAQGHKTIGVDQSPEMIAVAHQKVPDAEFRIGHLENLPLDDSSVDLAVCGLALTHLTDLSAGINELARVVRPGGRVIISDLHPVMVLLQGQFHFNYRPGQLAFIRNHVHLVSHYLAAFSAANLFVHACREPLFTGRLTPSGYEELIPEAARAAWADIPSALIWELTVSP
jgi:SAM-dependent methyltransferase